MSARNTTGIAARAIEMPPPAGAGAGVPEWAMIARTGAWLGHPTRAEIITPEHLRKVLAQKK